MSAGGEDIIDVKGYALILGLDSEESVKRLARKGLLAPHTPAVKQWRWRKGDIDAWFKQEQQTGDVFRVAVRGIASNLRRCRDDLAIRVSFSDEVGSKVYGQELILGTGDAGRVGPVELAKVDKSVALNALERIQLKEDFPELAGITDWADLTYGIATDTFLVILEAYF